MSKEKTSKNNPPEIDEETITKCVNLINMATGMRLAYPTQLFYDLKILLTNPPSAGK